MAGRPKNSANVGGTVMPPGIGRVVLAINAILLAGALYLIAVRGEALLADLSGLAQRILLCF